MKMNNRTRRDLIGFSAIVVASALGGVLLSITYDSAFGLIFGAVAMMGVIEIWRKLEDANE